MSVNPSPMARRYPHAAARSASPAHNVATGAWRGRERYDAIQNTRLRSQGFPMDERVPEGPQDGLWSFLEADADALARIIALVRRIIAARAYRIPRGEHPEILQEALLQVWRALRRPSADPVRSVEGLAATIAHRCCLAWLRRSRRHEELSPALRDPAPSAEDELVRLERRALGLRVIRAMPPGCREILRLHIFQKLTYREIAQRLNRSEHGLRTQACECLRQARAMIDRLRRETDRAEEALRRET